MKATTFLKAFHSHQTFSSLHRTKNLSQHDFYIPQHSSRYIIDFNGCRALCTSSSFADLAPKSILKRKRRRGSHIIIHLRADSSHLFITLAGLPAAIHREGMLFVTMLFAPIIESSPMTTPGRMTTF